MTGEYSVVGKRTPLIDAPEKVTGKAIYTGDISLPGMLYAKILRSPYAHARVLRVDTRRAERLPGVKAILSKNNAPRVKVPVVFDIPSDKVAFDDKVRYFGDEVAAVAAASEKIAQEAIDLIKVDYEELPAVLDPEEALKPGAPLIHEAKERNIANTLEFGLGNTDVGFKQADYVFEETFRTSAQRHACMETHCAIASFDSTGKLTVWTPTQVPFLLQMALAEYLSIPMSKVSVIKPYLGGGFGSKMDMLLEHICALLSKTTGYPVKIVLTRKEEFSATVSRHEHITKLKMGVKKDGTLTAIKANVISNEGAYLYKTGPLGVASKVLTSIYRCPNTKFEGLRVYTNVMSAGAYRGYGGLQGHFALESLMDMVAEKLGIDSVEFRLKNYAQVGDIGVAGQPITTCGLAECLAKGKEKIGWDRRSKSNKSVSTKKRGFGIACASHATGTGGYQPDYSTAAIRINADGTAQLFIGTADLGTGSNTTLAQIAAEALGLKLDAIAVIAGNTDSPSFDRGAFASKTLFNAGNAVVAAAAEVKRKILLKAAQDLKVGLESLEFKNERICVKNSSEIGIGYYELIRKASRSLKGNTTFAGEATFENSCFPPSFSVQLAEVEVDTETGQVELLKLVAMQESGKIINSMVVEGQIEGALQHSIGIALTENPIIDKKTGKMLNDDFANYMVLTALDMPRIEIGLIETNEPTGPFGAKGVSELPILGAAPAIANAIYNATGIRIKDLPMTQEMVFAALKGHGAA